MNTDTKLGTEMLSRVGAWRHYDLLMLFAMFFVVFFIPIQRETHSLLLIVASGLGLSRIIAGAFIGRYQVKAMKRSPSKTYLSVYLVSFPFMCLVGYITLSIARWSVQ